MTANLFLTTGQSWIAPISLLLKISSIITFTLQIAILNSSDVLVIKPRADWSKHRTWVGLDRPTHCAHCQKPNQNKQDKCNNSARRSFKIIKPQIITKITLVAQSRPFYANFNQNYAPCSIMISMMISLIDKILGPQFLLFCLYICLFTLWKPQFWSHKLANAYFGFIYVELWWVNLLDRWLHL